MTLNALSTPHMVTDVAHAIAPMVDGSEYPYRRLVAHCGVNRFWSPMYNVQVMLERKADLGILMNTFKNSDHNFVC